MIAGGYSAVVFDLDGTLADTAADIQQALARALATEGLPPVDVAATRLMIGGGQSSDVEEGGSMTEPSGKCRCIRGFAVWCVVAFLCVGAAWAQTIDQPEPQRTDFAVATMTSDWRITVGGNLTVFDTSAAWAPRGLAGAAILLEDTLGLDEQTGTFFVAALFGVELGLTETVALVAGIAALSFYSPGIPSGGLFVMAPLYQAFGLPLEGIGILIALDIVPDMFITASNVTADLAVAALVDR